MSSVKSNDIQTNNLNTTNEKKTTKYKGVTLKITLEEYENLLKSNNLVFYNKAGKKLEFENNRIKSKKYVKVFDKEKERIKLMVTMETYLHMMGDLILMEWDNEQVTYTTKINHADLKNWSGIMYWKEKDVNLEQ